MLTIQEFITKNGITMTVEPTTGNPNIDSETKMNHYRVIFSGGLTELTTFFSMGLGLEGKPQVEDVLDCLAQEASGFEDARTFEDWCDNFGYDTDSRKAERTWMAAVDGAKLLKSFLGLVEYDHLLNEVERL